MITAEQIRAALGALRWSRRELHSRSGVPERTIQRLAEASGVPNTSAKNLEAVQLTLEKGSDEFAIEFLNTSAPGIRIVAKPPDAPS